MGMVVFDIWDYGNVCAMILITAWWSGDHLSMFHQQYMTRHIGLKFGNFNQRQF